MKTKGCTECGIDLGFQVLQAWCGYYVATWCECGELKTRESAYFATWEEAAEEMSNYCEV